MDSLAGWLAGYPAGEGVDKHTNVYTTYAHKHNGTLNAHTHITDIPSVDVPIVQIMVWHW